MSEDKQQEKDKLRAQKEYDKYDRKWGREIRKVAKALWKKNKKAFDGLVFYDIEYSDNGGGKNGQFLEYANIFRNIPHIAISNH